MPWNNQTGGAPPGGGRGPWGNGNGGGGSQQPPDLEELLKRSQERLKTLLPGGFGSGRFGLGGGLIIVLVVLIGWLASGVYVVQPDEQGVVLRFGKYVQRTAPGINYHWPWPIERVMTPQVTRENQINIGYAVDGQGASLQEIPQESLMLTGDENIVDINFTVFWVIKDAGQFLFNVQNPDNELDATIKAVAESAMREVVGQNKIESILTQDRASVQTKVQALMQTVLDSYGAGVTITRAQMQKVDPPSQVIDSYRDVQAARTDQDRMRNEAEAYANKVIPEARGEASQITQQAEAYKQQVIAEAQGTAARFTSVYEEYKKAPDVTRRRMYLETMSDILSGVNKVIIDSKNGTNVLPYLPLQNLTPRAAGNNASSSAAGSNAGGASQ